MRYTDSQSYNFLQYGSPGWRNSYFNNPPGKYVDYQDPTYIGFYLRFYGLGEKQTGPTVDLDTWPGGLFYDETHPDGAIYYLKNIGEYTRAEMLKEFVRGIKEVSEKMPWYFTKISGLEEIWKVKPDNSYRGKDKKIVIETLESIDLKITYLMDLYRKATFDTVNMRWMLPENLRVFVMDLVITEIRSMQRPILNSPPTNTPGVASTVDDYKNPIKASGFPNVQIPGLGDRAIQNAASAVVPNSQWSSTLSNALTSTLRKDPGKNSDYPGQLRDFDELATFLVFTFGCCEFDAFADAPTYFGSLGKTAGEAATNKITINTGIIYETNTYGLLGAILQDTIDLKSRTKEAVQTNFWERPEFSGEVPSSEIGYLQGVKNEIFNNNNQKANQDRLKKANTRIGGLLGNLLEGAIATGASMLNSAVADLISNALLGNVFENTFGPTISQAISSQVMLNAPPIIPALLSQVVLDTNGATINGGIAPPEVDLTGTPPTTTTVSSVVFTGASTSNAPAGQTNLEGAPTNPSTDTHVNLQAAPPSNVGGGSVVLEEAPVGPIISTRVDLLAPPSITPGSLTASLEGAPVSNQVVGAVILEGAQPSGTADAQVDFQEAPISREAGGSVVLTGTPPSAAAPSAADLTAPPVNNAVTGQVNMSGAPTNEHSADSVVLTGPSPSTSALGILPLDAAPAVKSIDAQVQLESAPVKPVSDNSVKLEGAPVVPNDVIRVELEEPLQIIHAVENVKFEGAPPSPLIDNKVELIAPPAEKISPSSVKLESAALSEPSLTKIDLTFPKSKPVDIKPVEFEAPKVSQDVAIYHEKVKFQDAGSTTEGEKKTVDFVEPKKVYRELDKASFIQDDRRHGTNQTDLQKSLDKPSPVTNVNLKEAPITKNIVPPSIRMEATPTQERHLNPVNLESATGPARYLGTESLTSAEPKSGYQKHVEFESTPPHAANIQSQKATSVPPPPFNPASGK